MANKYEAGRQKLAKIRGTTAPTKTPKADNFVDLRRATGDPADIAKYQASKKASYAEDARLGVTQAPEIPELQEPVVTPTPDAPIAAETTPARAVQPTPTTRGLSPQQLEQLQGISAGTPALQDQISGITQVDDRYKQGLAATKGMPMTEDSGEAAGVVAEKLDAIPGQVVPTEGEIYIQEDPAMQQIMAFREEYMSVISQQTSAVEEYQNFIKDRGIEQMDTDLLNMKNVIEGTEDDIRLEVEKAGGFATNSQVMALTNSRNKQLIKNYNNLLQTRESAMSHIDNLMQFSAQDKQMMMQNFDRAMNFEFKIMEARDRAKSAAIEGQNRTLEAVGFDGIHASLTPDERRNWEKTRGMPAGSLDIASARQSQERVDARRRQALADRNTELSIQGKELALAQAGDKAAIASLGYDPNLSPERIKEEVEHIQALEGQKIGIKQDIALIEGLLADHDTIEMATGMVRGPIWSKGITGFGDINAYNDFIADNAYLIEGMTLNRVSELASQGVKLNPITEVELAVMGRSASTLVAGADKSLIGGELQGFKMSPEKYVQGLNQVLTGYQRGLDAIESELSLTPEERLEVYNYEY